MATLDTVDTNSGWHVPAIVRFGSKIGVIYSANANPRFSWRYRADTDSLTSWVTAQAGLGVSDGTVLSVVGDSAGKIYLTNNGWNGQTV